MPKSLKQKRIEALERMEYRKDNPVPAGQDKRVKKNPRTPEQERHDRQHLERLIVGGK